MLRHLYVFVPLLLGTAAAAQPVALTTEQEIKGAVTRGTLVVKTPFGSTLPVRFKPDGTVTGKTGGTLAFFLGASEDKGKWWISRGRLCQKWTTWFDGKLQCIRLTRNGKRIHWRRDDGEEGTAKLVPDPEQSPIMTAAVPTKPKPADTRESKAATSPQDSSVGRQTAQTPKNDRQRFSPLRRSSPVPQPKQIAKSSIVEAPPPSQAVAVRQASRKQKGGQAPARPLVQRLFRVAHVRSDDVLNIRLGPSDNHAIVGSIGYNGRGVRQAGPCRGEWCYVSYRGVRGWVNNYYLTEERTVRASAWPVRVRRGPRAAN